MLELDRNLYTVAWIAPLYIEAKAALLMLDQRHRGHFRVSRGDDYVYHAGSICGHNVVIATLPAGQEYGNGSAAALAGQLSMSFPNLWFGLLVGIAAGLPNLSRKPQRDIRLGDVLVALPDGDTAALVAYDLGKDTGAEGFQPLRLGHVLAHTKTIVRSAIGKIKLTAPNDSEVFLSYYEKIKKEEHDNGDFMDPGQKHDRLHDFDQFGKEYEVKRQPRPEVQRTRVWYGPIGSGEKLMRNGRQRNELRDKYNIIGLEMEAAGTMNRIPVGVIRGGCDYADEHKNKEWQPYAAAMAASYAKAVLREILPDGQDSLSFAYGGTTASTAKDSIQQSHFLSKFFDSPLAETSKKRQRNDEVESTRKSISTRGGSFNQKMEALEESRLPLSADPLLASPSCSMQIEEQNGNWPEFQTERPGLSAKYLQREDTPSQLLNDSDAWKTLGRRIPWIVVIYGLSGVGKSQMCLKAVVEHEQRFRGVFYIDASTTATADSNFVDIARVCSIEHHWEDIDLEKQISITRLWLACQKSPWVLMIDNADSAELDLKKYIPTGGPGTVLITTTDERFAMCGHNFCRISSMGDDEAFNLLLQYRRPGVSLDSAELEAGRTLAVQVLGGLPLAIAQAGSYIFNNHYTYAEYVEEFRKSPRGFFGADIQAEQLDSRHLPIWTTFALSLRRIQSLSEEGSTEAVELLKTLCFLHNEGIHRRIFSEAWKNIQDFPLLAEWLPPLIQSTRRVDAPNIRAAFNILCRYSLLNPTLSAKGQYSMHGLLQTICRELMSAEEQILHCFYAASLIATALAGIRTPLSWIENPSGFDLQKFMLPHIKACVAERILTSFQRKDGVSLEVKFDMLLLYAKANSATGHIEEAESLVNKGFDLLNTYPSSERPTRIKIRLLEQFATCEAHLGRHAQALKLRQRILTNFQSEEHLFSDTRCVAMMNVSDSLWAVGSRKKALGLAEECLYIRKTSMEPGHPKVHRTKRKVAEFLHGLDQRRRALVMREEVYREAESNTVCTDIEKLDFVASKSALSDSYQWDGRLLEALELRQQVYQMRNDILGPEHPETLLAHDRLLIAKRYCTRDPEEQRKICQLWKRSVVIWKRTVGDLHPHTLEARVNLGHQYEVIHEITAALDEQEGVLNIRRRQFEEDRRLENVSNYLSSMANVAGLLLKSKQPDNALNLRTAALQVARENCDPNDAYIARAYNSLLNCEADLRRRNPKNILLQRRYLLKAQRSLLPEQSPVILKTLSHMATDFEKLGRRTKAMKVRRQLLNTQKTSLGPENRETVDNMKKLALILGRKSRRDPSFHHEAISLLQEVAAIESRLLGINHFQTLATNIRINRVFSYARSHGNPTDRQGDRENKPPENATPQEERESVEIDPPPLAQKSVSSIFGSSDSSGFCSSSMAETVGDDITSGDTSDAQSSVSDYDYYHTPRNMNGGHKPRYGYGGPTDYASRAPSEGEGQPKTFGHSRRWHYSRRRYRYNRSPTESSFGESGSEASGG